MVQALNDTVPNVPAPSGAPTALKTSGARNFSPARAGESAHHEHHLMPTGGRVTQDQRHPHQAHATLAGSLSPAKLTIFIFRGSPAIVPAKARPSPSDAGSRQS